MLVDLDSRTGTYLNGERFVGAKRPLNAGDSIAIGDEILHYVATADAPLPPGRGPGADVAAEDGPRATADRSRAGLGHRPRPSDSVAAARRDRRRPQRRPVDGRLGDGLRASPRSSVRSMVTTITTLFSTRTAVPTTANDPPMSTCPSLKVPHRSPVSADRRRPARRLVSDRGSIRQRFLRRSVSSTVGSGSAPGRRSSMAAPARRRTGTRSPRSARRRPRRHGRCRTRGNGAEGSLALLSRTSNAGRGSQKPGVVGSATPLSNSSVLVDGRLERAAEVVLGEQRQVPPCRGWTRGWRPPPGAPGPPIGVVGAAGQRADQQQASGEAPWIHRHRIGAKPPGVRRSGPPPGTEPEWPALSAGAQQTAPVSLHLHRAERTDVSPTGWPGCSRPPLLTRSPRRSWWSAREGCRALVSQRLAPTGSGGPGRR